MADCAQSRTQALQCQHSSGYLTSGETPFPMALKTWVGTDVRTGSAGVALLFVKNGWHRYLLLYDLPSSVYLRCAASYRMLRYRSPRRTSRYACVLTGCCAIGSSLPPRSPRECKLVLPLLAGQLVHLYVAIHLHLEIVIWSLSFPLRSLHGPGKPERKFREDHHQRSCQENGDD